MKLTTVFIIVALLSFGNSSIATVSDGGIRVKELSRLSTARDNSLVGYGLVSGLAGTGDSARSLASLQSLSNALKRFGVNVTPAQLRSRNIATVLITATLPPFARPGDKIDVNVTSLGDARSLLGGTLMLTHLTGPDGKIYALAQGPMSVGGFSYDMNGNLVQKNHPTSAIISSGATIERAVPVPVISGDGKLEFVLFEPDFTTASRIASNLNQNFNSRIAHAIDAARIEVAVPMNRMEHIVDFLTEIENVYVRPDSRARLIVNERTGTVVTGGDVRLSKVSVTHGDLKVAISTENIVSQPIFVRDTAEGVRTEVVPRTTIDVQEMGSIFIALPEQTTVNELISALNKVNATSRDIITILQAIRRAGGLHAELIIQ